LNNDIDKDSDIEIDEEKTNNKNREIVKNKNKKLLESSDVISLPSDDENSISEKAIESSILCKEKGKTKKCVRFGIDILKVRLQ
jgi:hypothetical protein